jgi:hypothetical protein
VEEGDLMAVFHHDDVVVARVLFEDDDMMTLEIAKDPERVLQLDDGDRFFTMIFVQFNDPKTTAAFEKPWEMK